MAKHRNSPHMAFWKMLKQGNDHFEVTKREPKVEVCEKRYVFNAETNGKFSPAGACPPYQVNQEVAAAIAEKQRRDDRQLGEYISKGTPTLPVVTRTDGGMHPAFQAAFQKPYGESGVVRSPSVSTPGTIPAHAVPPREPEPATGSFGNQSTKVATAGDSGSSGNWFGGMFASNKTEQSSSSDGVFDRMSRFVGLKGSDPAPEPTPAPAQKKKSSPPTTKSTQTAAATPKAAAPKSSGPALSAASTTPANAGAIRPAAPKTEPHEAKPEASQEAKAPAAPEQKPASSAGLLNGTQPPAPTGSFNSRWGSF